MNLNNTERYNRTMILIHWLMLLLLAAVYFCIELREIYPKGSDPRNAMKAWHFMLGLCVWVLVMIRLLIRWFSSIPKIIPDPPVWQAVLSKLVHVLLYLLMVGMPLLGLIVVNYKGHAVSFFDFELPILVTADESQAELLESWHKTIGVAGYWLIGFHAAGALVHHFIWKDNTLKRMLP